MTDIQIAEALAGIARELTSSKTREAALDSVLKREMQSGHPSLVLLAVANAAYDEADFGNARLESFGNDVMKLYQKWKSSKI